VTTPTDDYYDLIGVDPSAPTDEIRERYRERRTELDARGTDDAREEAARLNRAWNVLSDPYQRGRYDAGREAGTEEVPVDDVEIVDEERPRRRGLFAPPPRAGGREPREPRGPRTPMPTVEYPGGYRAPENRRRIVAMVIDLFVILLMFVLAQFVLQAVIKERFPADVDRLNAKTDQIDAAKDRESNLNDAADKASQRVDDIESGKVEGNLTQARAAEKEANDAAAAEKRNREALEDEAVDIQKKFTGTYYLVVGGFVLIALAYLVIPSALTGQTLGKKLQRVKAMRADGSPLGWSGALARYGPLAIVTGIFLPTPLGQIVFVVALVIVLGWMRNANRQGWHDRLAKTIVVDAS
jgi:curved DNA-binding protein CbpA